MKFKTAGSLVLLAAATFISQYSNDDYQLKLWKDGTKMFGTFFDVKKSALYVIDEIQQPAGTSSINFTAKIPADKKLPAGVDRDVKFKGYQDDSAVTGNILEDSSSKIVLKDLLRLPKIQELAKPENYPSYKDWQKSITGRSGLVEHK
jgi:hypothetical protein